MSDLTVFERRMEAVEHAVADLRRQLDGGPAPADWLDRVTGSISDEAAFLEALEFGRAHRAADRPADEAAEGP